MMDLLSDWRVLYALGQIICVVNFCLSFVVLFVSVLYDRPRLKLISLCDLSLTIAFQILLVLFYAFMISYETV